MTPQPTGPAFFFYSPDPNPESRQHGRFIPQQHQHQNQQQHLSLQQMPMLPVVAPLPSTPVYSRPGSSSSQPPLLPKGFTSVPMLPSTLTPLASPMPIALKPTIVLDTELSEAEGLYSPSTPPLSSSGSVISSPGSCDMLQTPLNPMFSGLDGKEVCDMDGELESFPNLDWSACASPPLTPGKPLILLLANVHFHFLPVCELEAPGADLVGWQLLGSSSDVEVGCMTPPWVRMKEMSKIGCCPCLVRHCRCALNFPILIADPNPEQCTFRRKYRRPKLLPSTRRLATSFLLHPRVRHFRPLPHHTRDRSRPTIFATQGT